MTWWNEPTALILVFGAFCAGVGSCIAVVSSNIRMSRCHKIKCCCWECDRLVLSKEEQERELASQAQHLESQRLQLNRTTSGQALGTTSGQALGTTSGQVTSHSSTPQPAANPSNSSSSDSTSAPPPANEGK